MYLDIRSRLVLVPALLGALGGGHSKLVSLVALLGKVAAVPGKLGQWTGEEAEGSRVVEVPRDLLG